jgi:hypothetical protein
VVNAARYGASIWIDKQLGGVEASPGGGVPPSVNPETVPLLHAHAWDEDGPDPIGVSAHVQVGLIAGFINQSELDSRRTRRPESEERTAVAHMGTED